MSDPFVVDAVCHPYNFTPENHIGIGNNPYVLVSVANDKLVERK